LFQDLFKVSLSTLKILFSLFKLVDFRRFSGQCFSYGGNFFFKKDFLRALHLKISRLCFFFKKVKAKYRRRFRGLRIIKASLLQRRLFSRFKSKKSKRNSKLEP